MLVCQEDNKCEFSCFLVPLFSRKQLRRHAIVGLLLKEFYKALCETNATSPISFFGD